MKIQTIIDALQQEYPLAYAEDFDNVGLLVGDATQAATGVLVTHDVSEVVIHEAVANGCNFVLAFHPIIFSGLKRLTHQDYVQRSVQSAIRHDIAIYAIHTCFDNHPRGVNHDLAERLHLSDTQILVPKNDLLAKLITYVPHAGVERVREALFAAGGGHIGRYSHCSFNYKGEGTFMATRGAKPVVGSVGAMHTEPETCVQVIFEKWMQSKMLRALREAHPYEEVAYDIVPLSQPHPTVGMGRVGMLPEPMDAHDFMKHIKELFGVPTIRHSAVIDKPIQRVALLAGSGKFAIGQAASHGADAYITADLSYHDFFKAEGRCMLLDVGHFESERYIKSSLLDFITKTFPTFVSHFGRTNTNPVSYF